MSSTDIDALAQASMAQASMAQAIVRHHAPVFAPEGGDNSALPPQPVPRATQSQPAYLAALRACSALGFIAQDAECLARAWQAQTERTGQFDAAHWPDDARDFGLIPADAALPPAFASCPQSLGLYAVLPDAQWVGRMARAGVPTVQLRFKSEDPQAIEREVRAAVAAVQGTPALLFINDHWQAAIDAGAYGVHVGQEDLDGMRAEDLEKIRAAGLRLGVSTHGYAEMLRAQAVRPSYVALGAVFPTTLKRMATAPQGVARLAAYVRLMRQYPLVAIGGIGAQQFAEVLATGAGSIAVVRALVAAEDPEGQAQALRAAWR
ncbi:thiamine phosphate synthase [Comamonas endophytica]|uniref:Thiamine phosphate synthase n=1 Tax=Comamonas endophytica TaxID=2949090 RepID=A0ABY6GAS2_9BURK|nr:MULTISPECIES: thiamine phosphate synthase [unclassified Acidovorax]MCD2511685.1 thiamine phosphate synthase [Acidovorax sp. D4N7]UYG51415.1 thiamine phosphate synthase [Acidovorax sp. 5MLIR]